MDFWQYLMLAVVVVSAAMWRWNATSAALAFSYFAVQGWYLIDGPMDVGQLFMIDVFTIALIYCKAIANCERDEFCDGWDQLRCFLTSPTRMDRAILAIFPLGIWTAYVANIDEFARWYWLYAASLLQFLLAGCEALHEWRRAKASEAEPDTPSSGLMFALARAERWST